MVSKVRSREEVERVLRLAGDGLSQAEIARQTGIPRLTISGWVRGQVPRLRDVAALDGDAYSYLLGMYLGDGYIARFPRASCLRITLDASYPGIIDECVRAFRTVLPANAVSVIRCRPHNCVKVQAYSQRWPGLLPQHGAGRKHARSIELADWQRAITHEHPEMLIRGLIHSDGCRFLNRVRHGEKVYVYPRYMFSNRSRQIHGIFTEHLDLLGIEWRWSNGHTISIARRESVARLDAFVGPKR
jgi:transcriptional regulator with XRE-family HTH domain